MKAFSFFEKKCSGLPKSDLSPSVGVLIFLTGVDHLPITFAKVSNSLAGGLEAFIVPE